MSIVDVKVIQTALSEPLALKICLQPWHYQQSTNKERVISYDIRTADLYGIWSETGDWEKESGTKNFFALFYFFHFSNYVSVVSFAEDRFLILNGLETINLNRCEI